MLALIYVFFSNFDKNDWFSFLTLIVLFFTLLAIIWYSIETVRLRRWQVKQVQLSILDLHQRILMHQNEMFIQNASMDRNIGGERIANILNQIYKHGKLEIKDLYSPGIIKE